MARGAAEDERTGGARGTAPDDGDGSPRPAPRWRRFLRARHAKLCADPADRIEHRLSAPSGVSFLPWTLMLFGCVLELAQGDVPLPWLGAPGLAAFIALYSCVVLTAFDPRHRGGPLAHRLLLGLAVVTYALATGYGGSWLLMFPLLSLAAGTSMRGRYLRYRQFALAVSAAAIAGLRGDDLWDAATIGYGTFVSGLVTAVILTLFEAVEQLRTTRQELARTAVAEERLRFSRDLHDLLGHTLSLVVVKSEAARRLARRDLDAALEQVADIEAVGRQALTEIREAVTGYREGSLSTELDRARSALAASDIDVVVRESGPPLPPQTEALLGWVVREGVTNVVRHSRAASCRITLTGERGRVRLEITDDGRGVVSAAADAGNTAGAAPGSGLKGLTERLAAAGGSLTAGPAARSGFRVVAELPVEEERTA